MSRLEDLVRETLVEREADAPTGSRLLADVHRRRAARRRRVRWTTGGLSAAAAVALVASLVVVLPGHDSNQSVLRQSPPPTGTQIYPLPSDGWKPGDPALLALTGGAFHAARRNGQVCAWLGDAFRPMLWPAGYQVRLDPVELIAPDGAVVALEGEKVSAGGGGDVAKAGAPCARPGEWTFSIMGPPMLVTGVVTGRLIAVGGPTSVPQPLPGEIVATGPRARKTVQVGADGDYQLELPPGTYTITGASSLYADGKSTCRTNEAGTQVTAGQIDTIDVICGER